MTSALLARCLVGAVALAASTVVTAGVAPLAYAAADLGPVVALPFDSRVNAPAEPGTGTDDANTAVAQACNDGAPLLVQRWFRLPQGVDGPILLRGHRVRWIGAANAGEPIPAGLAALDAATGDVLGCGGDPIDLGGAQDVAVVGWLSAAALTDCLSLDDCSWEDLELAAFAAPAPLDHDSWQSPRVIASVPFTDQTDSLLADSDGPVLTKPCPISDVDPQQAGTVWWRWTADRTGDLPAAVAVATWAGTSQRIVNVEIGVAEITPDGPVPQDWLSDPDELCRFDAAPHVEAGKTYLIGVFQRYDARWETPLLHGAGLTLRLGDVVPGAPTGVRAALGGGGITVTWTPAGDAAASGVTGYRVRTYGVHGLVRTDEAAADATSFVVAGLSSAEEYWFDVTGLRGELIGTPSKVSDAVSNTGRVGVPRDVTAAVDPTTRALTVRWAAPDGVTEPTGYRVRRFDAASGRLLATDDVAASVTSLAARPVTMGRSYTFDVTAVDAAGPGEPSPRTAPVRMARVPARPATVAVAPPAADGEPWTLTWTAPSSDGFSPVTGWRVLRQGRDRNHLTRSETTVPGDRLELAMSDLLPGRTYTVSVAAINAVGRGPATTVSFSVPRPAPASPSASPSGSPSATAGASPSAR